jgi:hypothetical protein
MYVPGRPEGVRHRWAHPPPLALRREPVYVKKGPPRRNGESTLNSQCNELVVRPNRKRLVKVTHRRERHDYRSFPLPVIRPPFSTATAAGTRSLGRRGLVVGCLRKNAATNKKGDCTMHAPSVRRASPPRLKIGKLRELELQSA